MSPPMPPARKTCQARTVGAPTSVPAGNAAAGAFWPMDFLSPEAVEAFFKVIMIDLVLAGDNAVVIGLAAAGLPKEQRGKAILIGVLAATVLRILFALVATQLLAIVGLLLAGGVLLLWVCWKMWRELRTPHTDDPEAIEGRDLDGDGKIGNRPIVKKTLAQAVTQIVIGKP